MEDSCNFPEIFFGTRNYLEKLRDLSILSRNYSCLCLHSEAIVMGLFWEVFQQAIIGLAVHALKSGVGVS